MYPRVLYASGNAASFGIPIDAASARTFSRVAPSTSASRPLGTTFQFRHRNACSRSGKCGNVNAGGADPTGNSAGPSAAATSEGATRATTDARKATGSDSAIRIRPPREG